MSKTKKKNHVPTLPDPVAAGRSHSNHRCCPTRGVAAAAAAALAAAAVVAAVAVEAAADNDVPGSDTAAAAVAVCCHASALAVCVRALRTARVAIRRTAVQHQFALNAWNENE